MFGVAGGIVVASVFAVVYIVWLVVANLPSWFENDDLLTCEPSNFFSRN